MQKLPNCWSFFIVSLAPVKLSHCFISYINKQTYIYIYTIYEYMSLFLKRSSWVYIIYTNSVSVCPFPFNHIRFIRLLFCSFNHIIYRNINTSYYYDNERKKSGETEGTEKSSKMTQQTYDWYFSVTQFWLSMIYQKFPLGFHKHTHTHTKRQ